LGKFSHEKLDLLSGKGRLAQALLDLAEHLGQTSTSGSVTLAYKISNSDLAAMAGLGRENVSRILREWRERKIVTRSARYHCIRNIAALEHETESAD
jgi:CRP-like cAMP-binding protein